MTLSRYQQLDVFAARTGGGNPLGVVVDGAGFDAATMQRIAAWTGLVETTFLLPPTVPDASYRVRIFTPQREIPFAGHPSIGSAHAALDAGLAAPRGGRLVQECGAGLLPVLVEGDGPARRLSVQAPTATIVHDGETAAAELGALLDGLACGALGVALVEGGRRWWVAELADAAALRAWQPPHAAILALARRSDSLGLCVFAREPDAGHDLAVRAFPAGVGIVEDPASGAANGLIAAFIAQREPHGPLARGYRVSQGREIGHDARIDVRIDSTGAVWVGGRTNTMVTGTLDWPG
ncbi:PhzF family phenazine biosynthesis protein [Chiayiivirga flava]|uniref:PhzF family phenazine biosynthesis protein n=1 Tax=Chiayiivirga flava TaxID=659595 RepID=A0A7W8D2E9_9GAMM|nr:PhzF family phenazine biosynthesis protein [Chiayiivirga flava]MBB5206644.1 PhzF family phenazine biosynthesis protein [Chiayiivirga flava]